MSQYIGIWEPGFFEKVDPNAPRPPASTYVILSQHMFLAGLANVLGQASSNPFDVLKTRLQIQGQGVKGGPKLDISHMSLHMYQTEGLTSFYRGLRAAVYREFFSSGLRMGSYEPVKHALGAKDNRTAPLYIKMVAGMVCGAIGGICTPYDLMKVRYQSVINAEQYYALGGPHDELRRVWRRDGVKGIFRGWLPTTLRGTLSTTAQVGSYDHIKHTILNNGLLEEGRALHFTASCLAGVVVIVTTSPIDVIKTRVMNAPAGMGVVEAGRTIVVREGPRAFYKGALAAWLRIAPHTIVTFMSLEYLRKAVGVSPL